MTACTKNVWIVVTETQKGERYSRKFTAWNLTEILTFFNEAGISSIVHVEKTEEEVTYHY